ncbi:MAG: hypothetical protein J6S50_00970, partial [Oscillospiraceae bacterium]|nr:hypothetical protein [Oscillospiraceae bacterium]
MTRTQLLDARRNIRREIIAYLSIVIIGMLASLSYLGIAYSAATLKKDAVRFFNSYGLWDLEITSTMLMDEENLKTILSFPSVEEAERVWQVDTKLRTGGRNINVSVTSLPGNLSRPKLLEGRLPEKVTECAVEKELLDQYGLSVGQRISLDSKLISDVDPLLVKDFVITGVFQTPEHITHMVPVTPYILVSEDSFNKEGLDGSFMKIRIRVVGAPENRYSDAYWDVISPVENAINAIADEQAAQRGERLQANIDNKIAEGRQKLLEGQEELADGRRKIEEGYSELANKRAELENARRELDEGWEAIREAEEQLKTAKEQLDQGEALLAQAESMFGSVPEDVAAAVAELLGSPYPEMLRQYKTGRDLWYFKGEEYLDGVTLYEKKLRQIEEGEKQYLEAESALRDAEQQLADAEKEYADGEQQYQKADKELRDTEQIRNKIEIGRWVVLNNKGNPGFIYARENSNKLSSLSMSFSTIFLVVGALVIYATIGRMVEQQRTIIGATKALGLYNREVFAKYLYFACTATMLGVGLGILLAWLPLQRVVLQSYEKLLTYGRGTGSFLPLESGLVIAGSFTISLVAVYLGCGNLLRLPAIQLVQGLTPSKGRKKAGRSVKRNLYSHLIFRNMRTDWSRVLVTTVSIAGGCILMVVGFTLRYGISGVPDRQFGGILTYEAEVFYNSDENANASSEIEAILDRNALPHIEVRKAEAIFKADDTLNELTLIVAERGTLEGYFALRDLDSGDALELPDNGALVPRRFWEHYHINVGENVMVYDSGMNLNELQVTGVFENYYGQLFFMTPQGYEEVFLSAPEKNCFFVKTNGIELDTLQQKLADVNGLIKVKDASADRNVNCSITFRSAEASLTFIRPLTSASFCCSVSSSIPFVFTKKQFFSGA